MLRPRALVYRGPASSHGLPEAVAKLLESSPRRFEVQYAGPREAIQVSHESLSKVDLYAQPGGPDLDDAWAETKAFAPAIRNFVSKGGRYLGFCLGAYLAGRAPGFGLLPRGADTDAEHEQRGAQVTTDADAIIQVDWNFASGARAGQTAANRWVYFQEGPAIQGLRESDSCIVLGRYSKGGRVAASLTKYGDGWVGLVGPHPEATLEWFAIENLDCPHGEQFDIGHDLIEATMAGGRDRRPRPRRTKSEARHGGPALSPAPDRRPHQGARRLGQLPRRQHGVPGNDAAGEVVAAGDRVAPVTDSEFVTARSTGRSWLAADEDGTLATHVVFDERLVTRLPAHLDWVQASIVPCAGTTAWSALKGAVAGQTVLIQGEPAAWPHSRSSSRARRGSESILTSSSDDKLRRIKQQLGKPEIATVNYTTHPEWHEQVLQLTGGIGVDLVVENGGGGSLVKSMRCTRRGGVVSQVGYLGGSKAEHSRLQDFFVSTIIDRRIHVRGVNAGSKDGQDDLVAAISATQMTFGDVVDPVWPFEQAGEAIEYVWQGRQVGKVVIKLDP